MLADADQGSLDEACDALVRAALSNGGVDNTTVILLRIHEYDVAAASVASASA